MRLHENEEDFRDLCSITAGYIGIPEDAVRIKDKDCLLIKYYKEELYDNDS